eukprot:jgi/Undpi1/80/HiC_scaffold_1.g00080.m1
MDSLHRLSPRPGAGGDGGDGVPAAWADLDPGEGIGVLHDDSSSSDTGGDSQEEDRGARDGGLDEAVALQRRRAYIIAQLHTTGQSIRAAEAEVLSGQGVPEIHCRHPAPKDTVDESNSASFLQAVDWNAGTDDGPGPKPLTDRAAERAGALLRLFDADGDGALSFEEFRAYLVRLGRDKGKVGERLATNREFWLDFVADQAGPAAVPPSAAAAAATATTATISSNGNLTEAGFVGHRRMVEPDHPLELDLLELGLDLLPESLQRWLRAKDTFDRIDLEGGSVLSEGGKKEDRPQTGLAGSVAREEAQLLLADNGEIMTMLRVEEELSRASVRAKVLLQLVEERRKRNRLANSQPVSRASANDVEKVHRGLWLPWFLSGRDEEEGLSEADARATVRMAVGDGDDEDDDGGGGFSITASFIHQGNASTEEPVEPLPPGVGMSVCLDLEAKQGASEQGLKEAAEAVDKTNIDFMCRQLKLGLRPTDFVREMSVSFFCPLELSEILESERTVLNDRLKVSVSLEACFCGPLISRIMEETLAVMLDDVEQAAADSAEHDLGRARRGERTRTTAPDMEHPLVAPKRKARGGAAGGAVGLGGTGASSEKKAASSAFSSPATTTAAAAAGGGGRLRTGREKRHKQAAEMRWMERMWAFSTRLPGLKGLTLDLEAATPLEFLDSSWARAHLPARWRFDEAAAAATTEEGQRLAGLEEDLIKLGVSRELLVETMGEKEEATAKRLREAKDKQMEEYKDLNDALQACVRCLLGPRELRIQSGPNVIMVEMQGLDVFEALSTPLKTAPAPAPAATAGREDAGNPTEG